MPQTSVHIRPVHAGSEEHNERKKKLDHVREDLSKFNENWTATGYTGNADLLAEIKEDYKAEHGKKLHAKATPIREGVVVIQEDTTMAQLLAACSRCEEEFGIRLQAVSIHRDEGHFEEGATPLEDGPWVGNFHAHLTWCWYDWRTHTTCKLNRDDTAAMQTIFAQELGMDRGTPSTKKGLDAITFKVQKKQEQLAALEQQGKLATAQAAKLQADISALQEKEAAAIEKLQAAEKAASREQLRSNLADAGARVAGLFGRGALAEAKADREARDAAIKEAAEARAAAEKAQKAQKQAEFARSAAETAERTARQEKSEYGREMYENGVADGIKQGRQSAAASLQPLQEQLAAKQEQLDRAVERAETAEKEVKNMKAWNPSMQNWQQSVKDMRQAGMNDKQIQQVFQRGFLEGVQVPVYKHQGTTYTEEARVSLNPSKTTGSMFTWFNGSRLSAFLEKAVEKVKQALGLNKGRGMHM